MQSVETHFGDGRVARRKIELPDRRAQLAPSDRIFVFLRSAHLKVVERNTRWPCVDIDASGGEESLHIGVSRQLARADGSCQHWLRESLQRGNIDHVERDVGRARECARSSAPLTVIEPPPPRVVPNSNGAGVFWPTVRKSWSPTCRLRSASAAEGATLLSVTSTAALVSSNSSSETSAGAGGLGVAVGRGVCAADGKAFAVS
jgi:hypothetical protein